MLAIRIPNKCVFGQGCFENSFELIKEKGSRFLIITSHIISDTTYMLKLYEYLGKDNIFIYKDINSEPQPDMVDMIAQTARQHNIDCIIAVGGGSCIDIAKAVSALVTNNGSIEDYLEGVGTGARIAKPPIPYIAVPTTAGTGAECTKNAVITSYTRNYKKSFRDDLLYASLVIVDPELTLTVPPNVTAYTGMDAITQLIESFTTVKSNPVTEGLSLYASKGALQALLTAYNDGSNLEARTTMCKASFYSGICLANSGLGMAHGVAAGLGALYKIPHGMACAVLLPHVIEYNSKVAHRKYATLARYLLEIDPAEDNTAVNELIEAVKQANKHMKIPERLSELGVDPAGLEALAEASMGSSMSGNPIQMNKATIINFLGEIL